MKTWLPLWSPGTKLWMLLRWKEERTGFLEQLLWECKVWESLNWGVWGKIVMNFWKGSRGVSRGLDHESLPIPCPLLLPSQRSCGMTWSLWIQIKYSKKEPDLFWSWHRNWWVLHYSLYDPKWKMLTSDNFCVRFDSFFNTMKFVLFADFIPSMCFNTFFLLLHRLVKCSGVFQVHIILFRLGFYLPFYVPEWGVLKNILAVISYT